MERIEIFNFEIPVFDYLTGHEWEQVELLLADMPASDMRANLLTLKIFVDSRCDSRLDVEEVMAGPVDKHELHVANERLLAPFADAKRKEQERALTTLQPHLSTAELKARQRLLQSALDAVSEALSKSDGQESERSSIITTQGSDGQVGSQRPLKSRSS